MRTGELIQPIEPLAKARERCLNELAHLDPAILRLLNPHLYPAGLEENLHLAREAMLQSLTTADH